MQTATVTVPPGSQLKIMSLAALAPFLREAQGKQKDSEKRFWEKFGK